MLTFYHAPRSRSFSILWLLEELGVDYRTVVVDIRSEEGARADYRSIQPHGKVPAIRHDDATVTERAAICLYLGERFAQAGLAPAAGAPDRAAYLTMLVYCDAVLDPLLFAAKSRLAYSARDASFGALPDAVGHLDAWLGGHPHAAGERFTAADTQLGSAIHFGMNILQVLPRLWNFQAYLARMQERPALRKALAIEDRLGDAGVQ